MELDFQFLGLVPHSPSRSRKALSTSSSSIFPLVLAANAIEQGFSRRITMFTNASFVSWVANSEVAASRSSFATAPSKRSNRFLVASRAATNVELMTDLGASRQLIAILRTKRDME
jgi:hypothetical protein